MKNSCGEIAILVVLAVLFVVGDVMYNIVRVHPTATLIAVALLAVVCIEAFSPRTEQSSSQGEA